MEPFEFILSFASILVGLALADIAASLHRLLRARARIRWDWLPLAATGLVVMTVIQFWWAFYGIGRAAAWTSYGRFLPLVALLIVMFLLASAALPDEVVAGETDLSAYYAENSRYFWTLFSLFIMLAVPVSAIALGTVGVAILRQSVTNLLLELVLVSLAVVRRRRYHATMVVLLVLLLGLRWSRLQLVGSTSHGAQGSSQGSSQGPAQGPAAPALPRP
jgi:hypothetical protein